MMNRRHFLKSTAVAGTGALMLRGRAWPFAQSPTNLRKFVTTLPGLGPSGKNEIGQYIPVGHKTHNQFCGPGHRHLQPCSDRVQRVYASRLAGEDPFLRVHRSFHVRPEISGRSHRGQERHSGLAQRSQPASQQSPHPHRPHYDGRAKRANGGRFAAEPHCHPPPWRPYAVVQ